jgi:broad specificity phosphatase PhoE
MRLIAPPSFPIPDGGGARPAPEPGPRSGTRIWLVRHAEVHADWHARAYGNSDVPLSETGEQQTRALGASFSGVRLDLVVASQLVRARAMGEAIAQASGAPLAIDERLREIWRGEWQGLPSAEFRRRWELERELFLADPWNWRGHQGESDAQVFARAWPALLEALARARGGTLALASHYNVIRVLLTRALGWPPHESFAFQNDPAHAALLVDAPGGWKLEARNLPSALQPDA